MKKQNRLVVAVLAVAFVLGAATSSLALTQAEAASVRQSLQGVPAAELAAKAATLVSKAAKADKKQVAIEAVRAAIMQSPTVGPSVVAAIAKVAPEVAPAVAAVAAQVAPKQIEAIVRAASIAAPSQADKIAFAVSDVSPESQASVYRVVTMAVPSAAPMLLSTRSHAGVVGGGQIQYSQNPISSLPPSGGNTNVQNTNKFSTNPPAPQIFTTKVNPTNRVYSGPAPIAP